jgi:hypothetical protein
LSCFEENQMGELFRRYFELLAGRTPEADYGVIATPGDEGEFPTRIESAPRGCLCPGR